MTSPTFSPHVSSVRDQAHVDLLRLSGLINAQAIQGSPEGVVAGTRGDLVIDTSGPTLWMKTTGAPGGPQSREGWAPVGAVGGGSTDVLLVGDDAATINAASPVTFSWVDAEIAGVLTVIEGRALFVAPRAGSVRSVSFRQTSPGLTSMNGELRIAVNNAAGFVRQEAHDIVVPADTPTLIAFDLEFAQLDYLQMIFTPTTSPGAGTRIAGSVEIGWS